jgi:hypothetical protein
MKLLLAANVVGPVLGGVLGRLMARRHLSRYFD